MEMRKMRANFPVVVLCGVLLAAAAYAKAGAQEPIDTGDNACAGGTGISAQAQIARCTAIVDNKRLPMPRRAAALRSRCLLYSEAGKNRDAIADCDRAVRLDPHNRDSYLTRGKALRNAGRFDPALGDFTMALRLKPASPGVLTLRGLTYFQKGDYDLAIADYTQALKYWPDLRFAQSLLAQAKAAKAHSARAPGR